MSAEHTAEHVQQQVRSYFIVFLSLLVLTVVTVAVSRLHLPVAAGVIVALAVASLKGTLVAGIFMHLFSDKFPVVFRVLIFAAVFFAVMVILFLFGYFDTFASERAMVEAPALEENH
jgi:cytochrome c oxidase subunit 4